MHPILNKCRYWCEQQARGKFPADLCGFCAVGASRVYHRLKKEGYNVSICYGPGGYHVFNRVDDMLVDVTATQFGDAEVVVTPWKPAHGWYDVDREFHNLREFIRFQRQEGWTRDQIYDYYVNIK